MAEAHAESVMKAPVGSHRCIQCPGAVEEMAAVKSCILSDTLRHGSLLGRNLQRCDYRTSYRDLGARTDRWGTFAPRVVGMRSSLLTGKA